MELLVEHEVAVQVRVVRHRGQAVEHALEGRGRRAQETGRFVPCQVAVLPTEVPARLSMRGRLEDICTSRLPIYPEGGKEGDQEVLPALRDRGQQDSARHRNAAPRLSCSLSLYGLDVVSGPTGVPILTQN
jgi:hypothetical protein